MFFLPLVLQLNSVTAETVLRQILLSAGLNYKIMYVQVSGFLIKVMNICNPPVNPPMPNK